MARVNLALVIVRVAWRRGYKKEDALTVEKSIELGRWQEWRFSFS